MEEVGGPSSSVGPEGFLPAVRRPGGGISPQLRGALEGVASAAQAVEQGASSLAHDWVVLSTLPPDQQAFVDSLPEVAHPETEWQELKSDRVAQFLADDETSGEVPFHGDQLEVPTAFWNDMPRFLSAEQIVVLAPGRGPVRSRWQALLDDAQAAVRDPKLKVYLGEVASGSAEAIPKARLTWAAVGKWAAGDVGDYLRGEVDQKPNFSALASYLKRGGDAAEWEHLDASRAVIDQLASLSADPAEVLPLLRIAHQGLFGAAGDPLTLHYVSLDPPIFPVLASSRMFIHREGGEFVVEGDLVFNFQRPDLNYTAKEHSQRVQIRVWPSSAKIEWRCGSLEGHVA